MERIRQLRLLALHRSVPKAVCLIAFAKSDGSFYLVPFSMSGCFFYGARRIAEGEIHDTFDSTQQLSANALPKLSVHESGQVHLRNPKGTEIAGPLRIPLLSTLQGQHVCSVSVDELDALPAYTRTIKSDGAEIDCFVEFSEEMKSGRVLIFVNGSEPKFKTLLNPVVIPTLSSTGRPIYVGLLALVQDPLGPGNELKGITVIGGWDPTLPKEAELDYLYLRGDVTPRTGEWISWRGNIKKCNSRRCVAHHVGGLLINPPAPSEICAGN